MQQQHTLCKEEKLKPSLIIYMVIVALGYSLTKINKNIAVIISYTLIIRGVYV